MARKLRPEEEQLFNAAVSIAESAGSDGVDDEWFWQSLAERRDTALALTPEIQALLESKFPERVPQ